MAFRADGKTEMILAEKGEWWIFHTDDVEALQFHFDQGGTVEMLDGEAWFGDERLALYQCLNEHALGCLPVMMSNKAKPNDGVWQAAFSLSRIEWIDSFLKHGFLPSKKIMLDDCGTRRSETRWVFQDRIHHMVTTVVCKKATLVVLCIAKIMPQPLSSIYNLCAKLVWQTRKSRDWINSLSD